MTVSAQSHVFYHCISQVTILGGVFYFKQFFIIKAFELFEERFGKDMLNKISKKNLKATTKYSKQSMIFFRIMKIAYFMILNSRNMYDLTIQTGNTGCIKSYSF